MPSVPLVPLHLSIEVAILCFCSSGRLGLYQPAQDSQETIVYHAEAYRRVQDGRAELHALAKPHCGTSYQEQARE